MGLFGSLLDLSMESYQVSVSFRRLLFVVVNGCVSDGSVRSLDSVSVRSWLCRLVPCFTKTVACGWRADFTYPTTNLVGEIDVKSYTIYNSKNSQTVISL